MEASFSLPTLEEAKRPLFYGEWDDEKNEELFRSMKGKRGMPETPLSTPSSEHKKTKGESPQGKPEAGVGPGSSPSPSEGVQTPRSPQTPGKKHPLDVTASALSRRLLYGRHPFFFIDVDHELPGKRIDRTVVSEVAAVGMSIAMLFESGFDVKHGKHTESELKDILHAFHMGILLPLVGEVTMSRVDTLDFPTGTPEGSPFSTDEAFARAADISDQTRNQRADFNLFRKFPEQMEAGPSRPSTRESIGCTTVEEKSAEAYARFVLDDERKEHEGLSQLVEYGAQKVVKLLDERRVKQADYGLAFTSTNQHRLGVIQPICKVEIKNGDYASMRISKLSEEKGGEERWQLYQKDMAEPDMLEKFRARAQELSEMHGVTYTGTFLAAKVVFGPSLPLLVLPLRFSKVDLIIPYVEHIMRYSFGRRGASLTPSTVREASWALVHRVSLQGLYLSHVHVDERARIEQELRTSFDDMSMLDLRDALMRVRGVALRDPSLHDPLSEGRFRKPAADLWEAVQRLQQQHRLLAEDTVVAALSLYDGDEARASLVLALREQFPRISLRLLSQTLGCLPEISSDALSFFIKEVEAVGWDEEVVPVPPFPAPSGAEISALVERFSCYPDEARRALAYALGDVEVATTYFEVAKAGPVELGTAIKLVKRLAGRKVEKLKVAAELLASLIQADHFKEQTFV